MPELPEVETVRNTLKNLIIGKKIEDIEIRYGKIIKNVSEENFKKDLIGETFNDVLRKGKYLIFVLDHYFLISHLRMEGKYFFLKHDDLLGKHDHIIFKFKDDELRYNDTRKFGTLYLYKKDLDIYNLEPLDKLILDAIDEEFTVEYLLSKLKDKNIPIKTLLLNQEIVSGLGNIYVDEVLFLSKINPHEPALNLDYDDALKIVESSKKVLNKAIYLGGTTIRSYTSSLGVTGRFQQELLVHTKDGEPCPNCLTKIRKVEVGGRGTYYCPKCQKRKKYPLLIGITGGIATGKSEAYKIVTEDKIFALDADIIYKNLCEESELMKKKISEFFPEVMENNEVNFKKLGDIVFNDKKKLLILNKITHPIVIKKIFEIIKENSNNNDIMVIVVPLLFESHFEKLIDYVICISSKEELQITRLKNRNSLTDEEALKRIKAQMSLARKEALSDFVICNNDSIEDLEDELRKIIKKIKE